MELKRVILSMFSFCGFLLIVPYGIETADQRNNSEGDWLLIVPYGIETWLSLAVIVLRALF